MKALSAQAYATSPSGDGLVTVDLYAGHSTEASQEQRQVVRPFPQRDSLGFDGERSMLQPLDINHSAFSYYRRLGRVKRHVEDNLSEPIPVEVAARVAGLQPKYFSSYFRSKTGVRFTDWISHQRVARAVELIESRDVSLTRIGVAVGFQNVSTFERAFKKSCGMTPSEFRKQVRPD